MNEIFRLTIRNRAVPSKYRLNNLDVPIINQFGFGNKRMRSFGPNILEFSPAPNQFLKIFGNIR